MKIVFIGSGNLATHLSLALKASGEDIKQVFSKTKGNAQMLAKRLNCCSTDSIEDLYTEADVYIFSIKDDAIREVAESIYERLKNNRLTTDMPVFIHTAGSVPMEVFCGVAERYGVFYPMQTFSKDRDVDFNIIPCFVEGSDESTLTFARTLAQKVSSNVMECSSEKRRKLHLAAVFACNMTNHCYHLAERILEKEGIDFSLYLPLIDETASKVHDLSPKMAQTGPMVRGDKRILDAQLSLIEDELTKEIYRLFAKSIKEGK